MQHIREREALAVSGKSSIHDSQRSYNYEGSSYYASDLGISALSSTAGASQVKNLSSTKSYLNDIQNKFNSVADPRDDLQLLSRNRQQKKESALFQKEDAVPQVFRKMQSVNPEVANNVNKFQVQSSGFGQQSHHQAHMQNRMTNPQISQPFKIMTFQDQKAPQEESQKGFFEKIFGSSKKQQEQPRGHRPNQKIENINDIESLLIQLKNEMNFDIQQQSFTFGLKQQISVGIDLVDRVLTEQQPQLLQQLFKAIQRSKTIAQQQLPSSEQDILNQHFEQLEFLAQQKLMKININNMPQVERQIEDKQQFSQQISSYIMSSKGYMPTNQQVNSFYEEVILLRVPHNQWVDFVSKRI